MAKKTKRALNEELKQLEGRVANEQKKVEELENIPVHVQEADTRKKIAERFVVAYFILLGTLIVGIPIYNLVAFEIAGSDNSLQIPLVDILQTYSAIVGSTLGFVIGYYFKSRSER